MNINDYFQIISTTDKVLHAKMIRFWSDSIIDEVGPEFLKIFQKAADSFHKSRFIVLADLSDFGQPTEKGKGYLMQSMKYALENGLYKAVEVLPKVTLKMAVDQSAKETHEQDFRIVVKDLEEAQKVVQQLKSEI